VGAGNWPRVAATTRAGLLLNLATTGGLCAALYLLGRPALSLFLPSDSAALAMAAHANAIVLWSFVLSGASMVLIGVVRSTGAVIVPVILLFVSLWLVRFPLAYALVGRWQEDAIWWSFPVGSLASLALAALYYRFGGWRHARMGPPAG
jgi:Na+-driven multidrug efflux pump